MSVVQVNTNDEFKEVLKANDKVAVDFFATWCGPCKIIGPKFQQMATEPAFSGIKFIKVSGFPIIVINFSSNQNHTMLSL